VDDAVAPGQHQPERGDHSVVWWDPATLALGKEDQVGLRQQEILKNDESGGNSEASIRAHELWQRRRTEVVDKGSRATLVALTVTDHTRASSVAVPTALPVAIERVEAQSSVRPHGRRFGTLVHAVLAEIAFDAVPEAIQRSAALQGRYLGCSSAEIEAAAVSVADALRHPILRRAAAAHGPGLCRREIPLALRLDDGTVLDGVVDLAFTEEAQGAWTVVDFKTDGASESNRGSYEEQVRLYARAIAEATGRPARAVLLYV
jgi:ATP-dependent exoDNAse (exonuclease V) beta subunit